MRVFQRRRGHRYSLDDVLTARVAAEAVERPRRHIDLGCGIGSVLLMVASKHTSLDRVGIEAQEQSFALCQRNVARNGIEAVLLHADIRDAGHPHQLGKFELVTGTPPYKKPGTATPSPDPQRAHARVEFRGGIEDYLLAASRLLTPNGRAVICGDAAAPERALAGAERAQLHICSAIRAIPRAGRPALFVVWSFTSERPSEVIERDFVARDAEGNRTEAYFALRAFFGLPRNH